MLLIDKLLNHETLSEAEAEILLKNITNDIYSDHQIVMIISVFKMRDITVEELTGFRNALLTMAEPLVLEYDRAIDVCGTGGDQKNTFNISTITALVLAGGGYKVIKHGNYGVSSFCGSSTILEYLGYQFRKEASNLQTQLDQSNICFLHAPLFHPCLKRVSQIRKSIGVRTFFNFLGPLVNPVQPNLQLTGVFNLNIARLYKSVLSDVRDAFNVVHSIDGYDEVSLTSPVKCYREFEELTLHPYELTALKVEASDLFGGHDLEEAKTIFTDIIEGKGTEVQNEVIKANVALGIRCFKPTISLKSAQDEAEDILKSGRAKTALETAIKLSQK